MRGLVGGASTPTEQEMERNPMATPKGSRSKKVSYRGLVFAVAGRERPYDVYRFSGVKKYEKPNHNPFKL